MSDNPIIAEPEAPLPARVYLSYSRKDEAVMPRMEAALHECGYAPDFDQSEYDRANISSGMLARGWSGA